MARPVELSRRTQVAVPGPVGPQGPAGPAAAWGGITGTLATQADLQTALDAKVVTTRTVNGHALSADVIVTKGDLGLGNVENTALSTWIGRVALRVAGLSHALGGSRVISVPQVAAAQDAIDWRDVELDGTVTTGLTVQARVEVRTSDAGTSVTPKIRNVTDSTDAGVGSACSATATDYSGTASKQTIAVTLAAGLKTYRLQLTPSNADADVFGLGRLEIAPAGTL